MSAGAMVPQTGLRGSGVLVLVAGSREAEKGLIIAAAKNTYASNRGVIFPARIVAGIAGHGSDTGTPGSDDHAPISTAEFDDLKAGGAFAVNWRSGGSHYALAANLGEEVDAGRVVVVDVSRSVVTALRRRFARVHVVYVTKNPANLGDQPGAAAGDSEGSRL
ncbi:MAG: hypothetical protein ACTSY1_10600, partial [Alphaproteobacteria bacterium]